MTCRDVMCMSLSRCVRAGFTDIATKCDEGAAPDGIRTEFDIARDGFREKRIDFRVPYHPLTTHHTVQNKFFNPTGSRYLIRHADSLHFHHTDHFLVPLNRHNDACNAKIC